INRGQFFSYLLLVRSSIGLYDGEARLVDRVRQGIDSRRKDVVEYDRERGGSDIRSRVNQGLGNTVGQRRRVWSATRSQRRERANHPGYCSKQTYQRTDGNQGSHNRQVFLQHGHFQRSGFLDILLDSDGSLLRVHVGIGGYFFVLDQTGLDHVSNGSFLLVALSDSRVDISCANQRLDLTDEVTHVALARCTADDDETLDGEYEHHQEQSQQNGHYITRVVNHPEVVTWFWLVFGIVVNKVVWVTHDFRPHERPDNETNNDRQARK